ncbi:MAG: glycosyltransferase family 4 protein [Candidatus Sumerlaeaceae bacterium]|nr:glycosyltransferase family 4 protein [Candidatus Sumerlaeaceae bacterium]
MSTLQPKKVLIAQLNSVRSYRLRFYELLEERRPSAWQFEVVHDCSKERVTKLYPVYIDPSAFRFPILPVKTYFLSRRRQDLVWQDFFLRARKYDLVITDTFISNLTYVFVNLWKIAGVKRGYWGHTSDQTSMPSQITTFKKALEVFKAWCLRRADVFFAYTDSEKHRLTAAGFPLQRIIVLNNTIDTTQERRAYCELKARRSLLREKYALTNREVIIYLGRMMDQKRLDVLFEGFEQLHRRRPSTCLVLAGGGPGASYVAKFAEKLGSDAVRYWGPVDELTAQELLTCAELFCLPGQIGLAPLRALCFDLPVVAFRVSFHAPEVEYLNENNALLLPEDLSVREFAEKLAFALDYWKDEQRRASLYPTIAHLTMENMVDNFIKGVNLALGF